MCRCDFHHARAKSLVDMVVCNHRNDAVAQGQLHLLANQMPITLILWIDHDSHVTQHGFRAGGRHDQTLGSLSVHQLRTINKRVANMPKVTVFFLAFHFQIRDRAHQHRVPTDQALASVNQALLVQRDERVGDHW